MASSPPRPEPVTPEQAPDPTTSADAKAAIDRAKADAELVAKRRKGRRSTVLVDRSRAALEGNDTLTTRTSLLGGGDYPTTA